MQVFQQGRQQRGVVEAKRNFSIGGIYEHKYILQDVSGSSMTNQYANVLEVYSWESVLCRMLRISET